MTTNTIAELTMAFQNANDSANYSMNRLTAEFFKEIIKAKILEYFPFMA